MDIQKPANYFDWWKSQSDSVVFDDMMLYCQHVRDRTATERQYIKCCGKKDCTVSSCSKQTTWRFLKTKATGLKNLTIKIAIISIREYNTFYTHLIGINYIFFKFDSTFAKIDNKYYKLHNKPKYFLALY